MWGPPEMHNPGTSRQPDATRPTVPSVFVRPLHRPRATVKSAAEGCDMRPRWGSWLSRSRLLFQDSSFFWRQRANLPPPSRLCPGSLQLCRRKWPEEPSNTSKTREPIVQWCWCWCWWRGPGARCQATIVTFSLSFSNKRSDFALFDPSNCRFTLLPLRSAPNL